MIKADLIFTNATILTMDDKYHIYKPGALAVEGDSILAVGDRNRKFWKNTSPIL